MERKVKKQRKTKTKSKGQEKKGKRLDRTILLAEGMRDEPQKQKKAMEQQLLQSNELNLEVSDRPLTSRPDLVS